MKNRKITNNLKHNGLENLMNSFLGDRILRGSNYDYGRHDLYTCQRELLTQGYASDGIIRKIVDVMTDDALEGTPKISSGQLSIEDIDRLNEYIVENDLMETLKTFFKLNRLYGGSGLIIDLLGQDLDSPLRIEGLRRGDEVRFYAVDRWELSSEGRNEADQLNNGYSWGDYYYYGQRINQDRIITLRGRNAPLPIRQRLQGWGLSVCEPLMEPYEAYKIGVKILYELMSKAKIDVMKINGYSNFMTSGQEDRIYGTVSAMARIKNFKSTLLLDREDDYQQKQLNLTGMAKVLRELKLEVCAATDYPVSSLWGIQSGGFSSGTDDILKYNRKVLSEERPKCIVYVKKVLKIICKILFDFIPQDLEVEFDELTLFSQEQIEQKKQNEFARLKTLYDSKLLTSQELGELLEELQKETIALKGNYIIGKFSARLSKIIEKAGGVYSRR
jgi:phage-related protein (TIGR01555 family)